jgi:YfiH family protein
VLERRTLEGGVTALVSKQLESHGFMVAFTERGGAGWSTGPYRRLNLGLRTGDAAGRAARNRDLACTALGISRFATGEQLHGARVARVGPKKAAAGYETAETAVPGADALVTSSKGVALAVLTADCLPIALVDPGAGLLAVVHAGWRGIAAGIIPVALGVFDDAAAVRAVIGPGIGIDHYAVGEDVALAVSAATEGGAISKRSGAKLLLDLSGTAAKILKEEGVKSVERSPECTACERDRFFSYRRDGETGRQALVATRL